MAPVDNHLKQRTERMGLKLFRYLES